jgi:hypothetical protein
MEHLSEEENHPYSLFKAVILSHGSHKKNVKLLLVTMWITIHGVFYTGNIHWRLKYKLFYDALSCKPC